MWDFLMVSVIVYFLVSADDDIAQVVKLIPCEMKDTELL